MSSVLSRVTSRGLRRDSLTLMVGWILRIALQGAYFVIVARSLGPQDYGAFSAVLALTALLVPFSSLGTGNLLIKHVRREPALAASQWATAVRVTVTSGLGFTVLLVAGGFWLAPRSVSWLVLLCVGLADLVFARLVEVAGQAYLATGRAGRTATLPLWLMGVRLFAAGGLIVGPWQATPLTWAWLYLAASTPVALAASVLATRCLGSSAPDLRRFRGEWREGILFSVSVSAQSVYNDIDKAVLGRVGTLEATGLYTAAYRIIDVSFAPIRGLLAAAYPRFFDHQAAGIRATLGFTRRLARPMVAVGAAASLALFVGAGLVPLILGDSYEESVDALRALAVLPLLKVAHYLPADTLTGSGYQGSRTIAQVAIAVFNLSLNLVLIPLYSWEGAVIASLISDSLLAVALWCIVAVKVRQEVRAAA